MGTMQKLDPTKMRDWQIAEATLRPAKDLAAELGLSEERIRALHAARAI